MYLVVLQFWQFRDGDIILQKKIDIAKQNINKYIDFFKCPLCGSGFNSSGEFIKCPNNHTYDISKKGYINLFNGQTKIVKTYDRHLFSARKIISDAGLYNGLTEKICAIMRDMSMLGAVLDAGCGCGNLTFDIFDALKDNSNNKDNRDNINNINKVSPMFAVDLSKDGVDFAAGSFCEDNLLWIVGNLNNLPLSDNKFGIVLNIMSPANYAEFKRVLVPGGVLLKVIPDADYLKELRRFIYGENDKNEYSNRDVLNNLEETTKGLDMRLIDLLDVRYTHTVRSRDIHALFDMTPLTLDIDSRDDVRERLIRDAAADGFDVTMAFKIAVCEA